MRRIKIALCVLVFLGALGLTLYPLFSNMYAERHQSTAMAAYTAAMASADDAVLDRVRSEAEEYNRSIGVISMDGPDAIYRINSAPNGYESYLNINGDGVMGYIRIPSIDVTLPIYHGVAGDVLERGAGHLPGSSLPVGGPGTHAVIAAHSGLASQRMFSDLEQVQKDDVFYLSILNETHAYEVDQILVVEPDDASALGVEPGEDYVTLVTCTPYGVNTHRLLVRGRRIPYTEESVLSEVDQTDTEEPSTWRSQYLKGIICGLSILAGVILVPLLIWIIDRRKHPRRRLKRRKPYRTKRCGQAKRRALVAFSCMIFLLGCVIYIWPQWVGARLVRQTHVAISEFYEEAIAAAPVPTQAPTASIPYSVWPTPAPTPRPYAGLYEAMEAYNKRIYESGQTGLCDAWAYQVASFDLQAFGVEDGAIGVISIPAMDVELPIYLGASTDNMAKGAVHLSQTSLPIGGADTNCVIAAHRGWYGAPYFRYIDLLKIGDEVFVRNLWETLTYKVTDIRIINPDDVDQILIQPGKDMLTLLTCHPYASGGRYRYVVYCEREEAT